MSENLNHIYGNKSFTYYLNEYMVFLLYAVGIVGITAGSHKIGIPLYKINPMHWALYFIILFKKPEKISILFLAFILPVISTILTSNPIMIKSILIGVELSVYGILFSIIYYRFNKTLLTAYIISQIVGHIIYYLLKYILLTNEVIFGSLFTSSIYTQVVAIIILGSFLQLKIYKNHTKREFHQL